jgi:hypothetical protein
VIALPNDEPLIRELAFPDGMEVIVGPLPGRLGSVNWKAETKSPSGGDMLRDYPNSVPVRMRGLCGRTHWFNKRWIAPRGKEAVA